MIAIASILALVASGNQSPVPTAAEPEQITVTPVEEGLEVRAAGELFTVFRFEEPDGAKPSLYPLLAPGGTKVTRDFPFSKGEGEQYDHPHHRSLWFAHGDVNGNDFWHGAKTRIVLEGEPKVSKGGDLATVETTYRWIGGDGEAVGIEERQTTFRAEAGRRFVDFEMTVRPLAEPLIFGDTKEGMFGLRLAAPLRLQGEVAKGQALNSGGITGKACWGKRARWITYWGPIGEETVGVAIFDHPTNHAHPTWWHARDYGLVAANPFGVHDFEKKPAHTGDLTVPVGKERTFRYRVVLYRGAAEAKAIDTAWKAWSAKKP